MKGWFVFVGLYIFREAFKHIDKNNERKFRNKKFVVPNFLFKCTKSHKVY